MELARRVTVVTGGASGIGRALCRRFAAEEATGVVVADLSIDGAQKTAEEITSDGGTAQAFACDVAVESDVVALVDMATSAYGPIDLFCSNAGIGTSGGVEIDNETWQRSWDVNVMAHVYAARAVLP
ncbi:MAG TPA: SDR family NAD(P)-dependent oxidoreductase, partial [Acidimicrobiales bacterium]|nr:SDR family NAD(P)-dependent oxidoreductase [Acidimicrobiales bacterium]